MPKKIKFDNIVKKIEKIASKVELLMQNKLFIAFFLIVDGITFILNPDTTLPEMARNIILLMLLASAGVLITNLSAKTKDKKTIAITLAIIVVGIIMYIYPDLISAYIQLLLALFIIYDGLKNLASALNWGKLSKFTQAILNKYNKVFNNKKPVSKEKEAQRAKLKDVDDNINVGLEEQKKKLIAPLRKLINKANKQSRVYIAANVATIILGVVLLIFPGVSMAVWGIIFLYVGTTNLLAAVKAVDLARKIKEKKFREILFDAEKDAETDQKHSKSRQDKPSSGK